MPFTGSDAKKHTKKAKTTAQRARWAAVANSVLDRCSKRGGGRGECEASAIQQANGIIARASQSECEQWLYANGGTMKIEEVTKTIDGKARPAGDFLVVEDPEKVDTWHLPVKMNGTPDRALAGAAWAALFSARGSRGQKYAGPMKAEAQRKLKALYRSQEWDMPVEEMYDGDDEEDMPMPAFGALTFADMKTAEAAGEAAYKVHELTSTFQILIGNIMAADLPDKPGAIRALAMEFADLVDSTLGSIGASESGMREFAESDGELIKLGEGEPMPSGTRSPVVVDIAIIKPGPGNKRDGHYYPRDMLEKSASIFNGVDIFVTDHNDADRGERTKVGKIREVVGFTDDGAPIGRTIIYDPAMAEKIRNRAVAGELGTLHCSILASGSANKGKIDGKEYKIVSEIAAVRAVDLVSRAGAGGHAIALAESDTDGGDPVSERVEAAEEQVDAAEVEIKEEEKGEDKGCNCGKHPIDAKVAEIVLGFSGLPEHSQKRLANVQYESVEQLSEAIASEKGYIKSLAGAGRPFAIEAGEKEQQAPLTGEELERVKAQRFDKIMKELGV